MDVRIQRARISEPSMSVSLSEIDPKFGFIATAPDDIDSRVMNATRSRRVVVPTPSAQM